MNTSVKRGHSRQSQGEVSTATIATASALDSVTFTLLQLVPYYLRGIFTRRRFWTLVFDAFDCDACVVRVCRWLRAKYKCECLYNRGLVGKSLLVFGQEGIRSALDNSTGIYADEEFKTKGMSHFQPNGLTISRGDEWKDRRRFNETVLNYNRSLHQNADTFLEIIRQEVSLGRKFASGGVGVITNSAKYFCEACWTKTPAEDLEAIFVEQLTSFLVSPTQVDVYLGRAQDNLGWKQALLENRTKEAEKIRQDTDQTNRLYLDGEISTEEFRKFFRPIEEH